MKEKPFPLVTVMMVSRNPNPDSRTCRDEIKGKRQIISGPQSKKYKISLILGLDFKGKRVSHGPFSQGVYNLMGNLYIRIQSKKQNHDK